ncbi:MAG: TonB-dependent receptor [Gemmatimonadetes bacterium]|nr:TonB-dependent receptor [Gemmatimonadota bacterium]
MSVSRKMRQAVRGLAALVALLAVPLAAQGQAGRIAGTVSDSAKRPLDNASVSVVGTRYGAISDASGRYTVNNVPAGTYTVRVQRIGNKAVEVPNVVVTAGATAEVNVSLNAAALQLGGVVVSASRRVEKITDAPATVTRLEAAQIANSVGNSFAGALKEVKGIDYIQVGMTAVAINARGFNSSFNNRMLMMEDGRVAVLPENGLPVGGFTSIPKVDLAGVEVLIGPGSALYGPDASNGVLTLQSKDPKQFQGTTVEVAGGSRGFMDFQGRYAGVTSSGKIGYKLSGEYLSANEFQNELRYAGNVREQGIGGAVDWKTDVMRGEGALVYYAGANRFEANAGMSKSNGVGQTNVGRNQLVNWQYRHAQLKWTAPRWYANAYATQSLSGDSYAINRYASARLTTPATISDDSVARLSDWPAEGRLYAAELQNNFTIAPLLDTRVVWGAQVRRDDVSSKREWLADRVTNENIILNQQGVYAQTETPLSAQLRVVLSGRYDKSTAYDANFSPKAAILYTPVNDQTIRLTYNRAFKTPTILNNYFSINDFVKLAAGFGGFGVFGNKEGFSVKNAAGTTLATYQPLVPEENTTYEVGYKGILKDRVFIDAAYYQADYKDFISPLVTINSHLGGTFAYDAAGQRIVSPNGAQSVLTYLNLGKAKLKGMDAGVRWVLTEKVAASGTLSLTKLSRVEKKPTDPAAVVEATALNTTPTKWNVGMDFNSPERNLLGGFTIRHVTGYNFRSGINAGIIPTFETLDLTLGKRIPSLGAQVNVSLQNIAACSSGSYELRQGQASPGAFVPKRGCNIGKRHLEMINMPTIGTMLFVGVRYDR